MQYALNYYFALTETWLDSSDADELFMRKLQFDHESGRRRTTLWMCYP